MTTDTVLNFLTRLLNYIFAIPMLIMGMLGSFLIILVITQKRTFRHNTCLTYLLAGAILTGIHLPAIYIQMILVYGFGVSLMNTNETACHEHTYLRYVTTVAAISFPCWAAFDQYVNTSHNPTIRRRWSSIRLVRLIIIANVIFWLIIYIPIIFNTGIINGVCNFIPSPYTKFNIYVFTPLVYGIGPAGVITYCTWGIVRNLRSNTVHASHDHLTKQVRGMLMPQLIIIAISGIPFGFQNMYLDLTSHIAKDVSRIALENFIGQIILLFYHFNYVFTFYIYVYMSSEFRKALSKQFHKCIRFYRVRPVDRILDNSTSLHHFNTAHYTKNVVAFE